MTRTIVAVLFALPLVTQTLFAAPASSFQAALSSIHQTIRQTRADQIQAKDATQASRIRTLANNMRRYRTDVMNINQTVSDIGNRAQRMANDPDWKDPFLEFDIRILLSDMRDLNRDLDREKITLEQILREAKKSSESISAAKDLVSSAGLVQRDAGWLQSEASSAGSDLSQAEFTLEGLDIEREANDIEREASSIERNARVLQSKVR